MLAQFEAGSNAAVDAVPAGVSRSKIFRILNLGLIALAVSGCAIPLRESDGPSKSAGSADWLSEFPIVSRSREVALGTSAAFAQAAMVNGEVKKIDEAAGKVTLKHGPIKNLDMEEDGMTMVFRVQDPAMLKQVKVGDKVQFEAERATAGITITKLQKSK